MQRSLLVVAGFSGLLILSGGCKKKQVEEAGPAPATEAAAPASKPRPATPKDAEDIQGTADVMAALDKKNYEGAVGAYMKARQTAIAQNKDVALFALTQEVTSRLRQDAQTDQRAAEALNVIHAAILGR